MTAASPSSSTTTASPYDSEESSDTDANSSTRLPSPTLLSLPTMTSPSPLQPPPTTRTVSISSSASSPGEPQLLLSSTHLAAFKPAPRRPPRPHLCLAMTATPPFLLDSPSSSSPPLPQLRRVVTASTQPHLVLVTSRASSTLHQAPTPSTATSPSSDASDSTSPSSDTPRTSPPSSSLPVSLESLPVEPR